MSPGPLPDYVDASQAFARGDRITASVPLQKLSRLEQYLYPDSVSDPHEGFRVDLVFSRDPEGRRLITGQLQGELVLECQRCLGPVRQALQTELSVLVVNSEEALRHVDGSHDAVVVSDRDGTRVVELLPLVEDELILALPSVPRHAEGECPEGPGPLAAGYTAADPVTSSDNASTGIARNDADMQEKLRQLRDSLAGNNSQNSRDK